MINDWIMRQIELMAQGLAKLFNIEQKQDDSSVEQIVQDYIGKTLKKNLDEQLQVLVSQKKLCEAEDLLFACVKQFPPIDFELIGANMYNKMQEFSDEILVAANFPRQEIQDGINALKLSTAGDKD